MKKILKAVWILFLFCLLVLILAAAGYWVLAVKGWPWWIAVIVAVSSVGVVLGVFAVKKYLVRRNEKKFVQSIIHQEASIDERPPDEESYSLAQMQAQWKESIEKLKKSHLRKLGNPLYVLPWYMMLGESRSGKTSAIKNSNLSSPLTDVSGAAIVSGTKNCDWWFLEQAIVLDTAGRYTIPIAEEADKKEWQQFLTLLAKYRKKEPINGVIVTVASNDLLNEDTVDLSEKAKSIRQRINQMMRILGAKFPVYLLVTKMDLVNGFTDFCDYIPEQRITQVMGFSNENGSGSSLEILERCMSAIYSQIRSLRSIFIHNRINNHAISFSNEFLKLKPGLETYVQTLFGDDIYQETPRFRGIYFSSACRKGTPESGFLKETGIVYNNEEAPDKNKGFFLKSFFSAILPKDRNIFTPLTEFIMWRRTTLSLGIFSLMLLCLAMSGLLFFSYTNNLKALDQFDATFFKQPSYSDNITDNLLVFDRQRFEIDKMEESNSNWIFPRLGLRHSLSLEETLKKRYVADVRKILLDPADEMFFRKVDAINLQTPYEDIVDSAVYAVRRIIVLKSAVQGDHLPGKSEFERSISNLFPRLETPVPAAIASKFAAIYYDCLTWEEDVAYQAGKLEAFQKQLARIAGKSGDFNWLLSQWICKASDVGVPDFIKGHTVNTARDRSSTVKGGFTHAGRQEIKEFITLIEKAFSSREDFSRMEEAFWAWYVSEFYNAWHQFASTFPSGSAWQRLIDNWNDIGMLMTTEQNPYFLLLSRMADEFEMLKKDGPRPAWANTVLQLKRIKYLADTAVRKEKGSLLAKLTMTTEKLSSKIEKKADKVYKVIDRKDAAELEYSLKLSQIWNEYLASLKSISPATSYSEKAFHMFSDLFKALSDSAKQEEPYSKTHDALAELKSFLRQSNAAPAVTGLIQGPYDFMIVYGVHNTVIHLQEKWEEIVLSAAHSVDPETYHTIMFDRDSGVIWKFVNEYAGPFLTQSRTGFSARQAFGTALPFTNEFIRLLNQGEKLSLDQQNEYTVSIQTAPIDVNRQARIRPYSNTLVMECADEKTQLVNNNFLETRKFTWKPATCGDVTLEINFGDTVLKKKYPGKLGFAKFLKDFKDGTRLFNISDFPEHMGYLTNNGVTDITVSYQIEGIEPVLNFLNRRPPAIQESIFRNIRSKSGKFPKAETELPPVRERQPQPGDTALKDRYTITLETIPMGVNPEARVKPVAGILWMNCENDVVRFENNNYPDSVTFDWRPGQCGKVILIIHFPELTLVRQYDDFLAFARDFNYSSRTFSSDEFPEHKEDLLKSDISAITLSYRFKGDLPPVEGHSKSGTGEKTDSGDTGELEAILERIVKDKSPEDDSGAQKVRSNAAIRPEGNQPAGKNPSRTPSSEQGNDVSLDWITRQDPRNFTLHMMMGASEESVRQFARAQQIQADHGIYRARVNGRTVYNLVYGSFESFARAQKALNSLPESALVNSPWIRRFASITKEMEE